MPKFMSKFDTMRKNTSLFFVFTLLGLAILTSAFYYIDSIRNARLTLNSKAAPPELEARCQNGVYYVPSQIDGSNISCGNAPNCGGKTYTDIENANRNNTNWQGWGKCWYNRELGVSKCDTTCKGYVPLCCYAMEQSKNPEDCYWVERKYCHPQQCNGVPGGNCGDAIVTYCKNVDKCVASASDIPYIPLSDRLAGRPPFNSNPTATPTPATTNPINCPTTSTNTYNSRAIATAESVGDRTPAEFHPDKNFLIRGYRQNDNNPKTLVNNNDPNPDLKAPQLTTMTTNRTPAIFHTYEVYDWNWGTAPNWGTKGAPLVTPWPVTAVGFYGNPGDNLMLPNSGYTVGGGYMAYVIYAARDPVTTLGTISMVYLAEDRVSGGYTVQYDNFCIDPNLLALYQQLSPSNKTNRAELPVLRGGDVVGKFKTNEVVVAIKDKGQYMDPRSIAWWQGVSTLPPVPTAPTQCAVPADTSGMQAVRNGNQITLSWNPNPEAVSYSVWVDNKKDGFDGSCSSPAGDFCFTTAANSYTFVANPTDAYDWSIHTFNSCGQVKAQYGTYIPVDPNQPTATPTNTPPPACPAVSQPSNLKWSCYRASFSNMTLSWDAVPNATSYEVEIDDLSDGWFGCGSGTISNDTCLDVTTNTYTFNIDPSSTYTFRVKAKNNCMTSSANGMQTIRCGPAATGITTPTTIPPTGSPTAVPTSVNPPTNTPSPTNTPTATPTPAPRYADCNACGYCTNQTKQPGNYKECMKCLYPNMTEQQTLLVDPLQNKPPQPATGKYFSQLGCIDVGAGGFKDPSAAGGVLNVILNRLLFPITGILALLALIYGAFLLITGQDDPEQIARGKSWIYGGIIGVVFTFSAILIIRLIASDILKIPGFNM